MSDQEQSSNSVADSVDKVKSVTTDWTPYQLESFRQYLLANKDTINKEFVSNIPNFVSRVQAANAKANPLPPSREPYDVSLKNLPLDMKPLECWLEKK
jgi:hypothetical protein